MSLRNTTQHYGSVTKFLHWLIFILVLANLIGGYFMGSLGDELKPIVYNIHKLNGLTILALIIVRLLWRLINPVPAFPKYMSGLERVLAKSMHYAFYIVLIAMPLTGWFMATAAGKAPHIMGIGITAPGIPLTREFAKLNSGLHELLFYIILAMLALHIIAAFKHKLLGKGNVFQRMMPGGN